MALCAALLLAACHRSESTQAPTAGVNKLPANVPVPAKRGPTPEELTAGMVEAVSVGKSQVPVALKFEVPTRPAIGQPLGLVLAVLPREAAGGAFLKLTGSDGLQTPAGDGVVEVGPVDPTEAYRVTVAVTPTAEGVQFLAVDVTLKHDDVTDTRSFSVPLIVPPDAAPAISTAAKQ